MNHLRQALRSLLWNPAFTITAVVTLSLGIGLSTAMFSFIDAVLLKPVGGIVDEDRLVLAGEEKPGPGDSTGAFSPSVTPPVFLGWREHNTVFAHVGASTLYTGDVFYTGADRSEVFKRLGASTGFFEALGVSPLYGRFFQIEEERAGSERVLEARYARTRKDIAVRVALGASRLQVIRPFVIESLALCIAGGLAGVFVAYWLMRGLLLLMPPGIFAYDVGAGIDARVLIFTGVLSLLTGFAFSLLPALTFARADVQSSGLNLWAASTGSSRPVARQVLLVGVVALTFTLVSGSVLLLGSLGRLLSIDPGFRATHTIAMQVRLDRTRYSSVASALTYQDLMLERVRTLPGVASAAVSNILPLTGRNSSSGISLAGLPASRTGVGQRFVSPDYFTTMGVPLLRGRAFTAADTAAAPRVAVINEAYAKVLQQYRDPIGAELLFQKTLLTIVGIAGNVRHRDLTSTVLNEIFVPLAQAPEKPPFLEQLAFVVQTTGEPRAVMGALTRLAATGDKDVAVTSVRTMDDYLMSSIAKPTFVGALFGLLGGLSLALTAVGIYGVLSTFVNQRTREFGIRLALGAQRRDLLRQVMVSGLAVTGIGIGLGALGAVLLGRALSSLLFEISASDPAFYAGAAGVLAVAALLACFIPAWRAATADPLVVLRAER